MSYVVWTSALLLLAFALLQTRFVKEIIRKQLISSLEVAHIQAELSPIEGRLPFQWEMNSLKLEFPSSDTLVLEKITLRIAILPLFKGRCEISYLHALRGLLIAKETEEPLSFSACKEALRNRLRTAQLPLFFSLESGQIDRLQWGDQSAVGIRGKLHLNQKAQHIDLCLFSPETRQVYVEGSFQSNALSHAATLSAQVNPGEGSPLKELPLIFQGSLEISGPQVGWKELIEGKTLSAAPLTGSFQGTFLQVAIPEAPFLNRDWSVEGMFSLGSLDAIEIKEIYLDSDLLSIQGKGIVQSDLKDSACLASFTVKDLASLHPSCKRGQLQGTILYDTQRIRCHATSQALHINDAPLDEIDATIEGHYTSGVFTAQIHAFSQKTEFSFTLSTDLTYIPSLAWKLDALHLSSSAGSVEGSLAYEIPTSLIDSHLSVSLHKLEEIAPLLGLQTMKGALEGELTLFSGEGVQGMHCAFTSKLLRYKDLFIDACRLNCSLGDLLGAKKGNCSLAAEKIYMRGLYLDSLQGHTMTQKEETWFFDWEAGGHVEGPFTLFSQGTWSYTDSRFVLRLDQLLGTLSGVAFQSESPILFTTCAEESLLTPLNITLGQGYIQAFCKMHRDRTHATFDMIHVPLEILRCLRPQFALDGYVSAGGFLEANADKIQGALNVTLEQASVTQFGKEDPLQAKGSMQLHLNQETLQVHCDLKASDKQFLNLCATLPIDYNLYPFSLRLNTQKNASAELMVEGKLEELFDFVNLGMNHFEGLISCRLLLSGTLSHPALQGPIDWQHGSYKNDFIGIALQSIQGQLEAQNDTIRALSLTATDRETGQVNAKGQMELKPIEHFPFTLEAQMKHLHAVQFDMIDAYASGTATLSGNTRGLLIQGKLLLNEALVSLTEQLPYDIPSIPFTYVNKPIEFARTPKGPEFILQIDLEVQSEGTVRIEGRGIDALLEGQIHLQGVNGQISAKGAFQLVKGEYLVAGKVFKLVEAELVFNDKPAFSSYLNVEGTLSLSDSIITVNMRGPLMTPQITLQSNPDKTSSAILALILFDKKIADINPGEAIQLASTLISLSGGMGPDVLSSIRKTLGVDRLNLVSHSKNDKIAVQIGKYLFRGVLVTLSQSATSSQVMVEVELPKGFVFQAENPGKPENPEKKEGKFSLKWRKIY